MLDELMGKERNVPLTERTGRALKFSDPEICKYALGGLCPYGLFRNTKSDLGVFFALSFFIVCLSHFVLIFVKGQKSRSLSRTPPA